jgi:cell pole-organizing protein PopZ
MQKPVKATEPSMEEILASIRKIIAEEPIGSRAEPGRRNPGQTPVPSPPMREQTAASAGTQVRLGETGHGTARGPATIRGALALDDPLADLVEDAESDAMTTAGPAPSQGLQPSAGALPTATPAAEAQQRSSWLFGRPSTMPNPAPVTEGPYLDSSRAAGTLPSPRDVLRPGARLEPKGAAVTDQPNTAGPETPTTMRAPVGEFVPTVAHPAEAEVFGAVIPGQRKGPGQGGAGDVPSPPAAEMVRSQPMAERSAAKVTLEGATNAGANPACAKGEAVFAPAPQRGPEEPVSAKTAEPIASWPRTLETAQPAAVSPPPAPVTSPRTTPAVERVMTSTEAASSALNSLAQGLATATVTTSKAVEVAVGPDVAAAPVAPPVRTLEDTVSDLLRPMLRQWLDSNMPRIVEKALRVELAESAKPTVKEEHE